jgi:hypothetical protein
METVIIRFLKEIFMSIGLPAQKSLRDDTLLTIANSPLSEGCRNSPIPLQEQLPIPLQEQLPHTFAGATPLLWRGRESLCCLNLDFYDFNDGHDFNNQKNQINLTKIMVQTICAAKKAHTEQLPHTFAGATPLLWRGRGRFPAGTPPLEGNALCIDNKGILSPCYPFSCRNAPILLQEQLPIPLQEQHPIPLQEQLPSFGGVGGG